MYKAFYVNMVSFFTASLLFAAKPVIVDNSVSVGYEGGPLVEIAYTLTGEPAVVTIDIATNTLSDLSGDWVSINGKGTGFLGGEANKVVYTLDSSVKAYWNPYPAFGAKAFDLGKIRVSVSAYPTNSPPNYMVVDLKDEQEMLIRQFTQIRYYASTNDFPGGFEDVRYKTSKLVMRKIPAKNVVWWMGSPMRIGDESWNTVDHVPHKVKLTEDYFAGVYELTIGQLKSADIFDKFPETNFTDYAESDVADFVPAERLGHYIVELRGLNGYKAGCGTMNSVYGSQHKDDDYFQYCLRGHEVAPNSVIDLLRNRTGLVKLDLPTEAQWEFAARAGSNTELPCNMEYNQANVSLFACMFDNGFMHQNLEKPGPMPVGSLKPNDWGLYDVLGNVREICLDARGIGDDLDEFKKSLAEGWGNGAVTVDPIGIRSSTRNMIRGWDWRENSADGTTWQNVALNLRSNVQISAPSKKPAVRKGFIGVRLFCPVAGNVR